MAGILKKDKVMLMGKYSGLTRAKALQIVSRFQRETRRRHAAPKSNAFTLGKYSKRVDK